MLVLCCAAPLTVAASEGLIYAAVYTCNATELTEALVAACIAMNPSMTDRFSSALIAWKERNATAAANARKLYVSEMRKRFPSEEQFQQVAELIKELKRESLDAIERNVKSEDACPQALIGMESEKSDVDWVLK